MAARWLDIGGQRKVDAAALQVLDELLRVRGNEAHPDTRPLGIETPQDRRRIGHDQVYRQPELHLALEARRRHGLDNFIVHGNEALRKSDELLTSRSQRQPLVSALEERLSERVFEPLDLQADGGLRAVEQTGRTRDASSFHNGQKGPEDGQIEIPAHVSKSIRHRYECN
jgi:hypothetical protein